MAHNKIIDSVKKQGQVAIKDLDEFLRFVINESDMRTYDDNYISILIPMKFDIDKVFGLNVCKRSADDYLTHSHPLRSGILALCNKRWLEVFLRNRVEFTAVFELTLDLLNYGLSPFVQQFQ
jgi:hypothetical protein